MKQTIRLLPALLLTAALLFTACNSSGAGTSEEVIMISEIPDITIPVLGAIPVTTITETDQYTGTVTWDGGWSWSPYFGGNKAYTATITLTAKSGYTFSGVASDFFRVSGADTVTNHAGNGIVTATFPATASVFIGGSVCGGKVAYILNSSDADYVAGEQRGLIAAAADTAANWEWGFMEISSTSTDIGTGASNTEAMAQISIAAYIVRECNDGGYTDWFIPSRDELAMILLYAPYIGNFSGNTYWSSSYYDSRKAWFGDINMPFFQDTKDIFSPYSVHAARYF